MKRLIGWLRQQIHCLIHFHRAAKLDGLYSGPDGNSVPIVTLGCADCGRIFHDTDPMSQGEPMHLSEAWFKTLKRVEE